MKGAIFLEPRQSINLVLCDKLGSFIWFGRSSMRMIALILSTLVVASVSVATDTHDTAYVLGADDQISVRVLELEEFSAQNLPALRIDPAGDIRLPLAGRVHAAGLTVERLQAAVAHRLSVILKNPEVTVSVVEFRSHPVSVLGAVKTPGVYQITGRKTLFEVLSLAGGLNPDAGNTIKVTRRVSAGPLPLSDVSRDPTNEFFIGSLDIRSVMEARNPGENINILAEDVITVPKAELVYVIGAVKRSGGFILNEKGHLSALQALALAEGLDHVAAPKNARILRQDAPGAERKEVAVNLKLILEGRAQDVSLRANDILFIPTSLPKNAGLRALEASIQLGAAVIYRY